MNYEEFKTRLFSFIWRAGGFTLVAAAAYLVNIADIREIDFWKLATIFVTTIAAYIINEATKQIRNNQLAEKKEDLI